MNLTPNSVKHLKNSVYIKKIRESPDEKYSVIYDGTGVNKFHKGNINKFIQMDILHYNILKNPFIVRERMKKNKKSDPNKVQSMFLKLNNSVNENNNGTPINYLMYIKNGFRK